MKQPTGNYVSPIAARPKRAQAFSTWGVFGSIILVWTLLILLAPFAEAGNLTNVSNPLYNFFANFCHQDAARSFHFENHPFAVCTRCFGIYFGLLAGFAVYPFWRSIADVEPVRRGWLFLAMIPMAFDWTLGFFGILENTHWTRFLTGAILGSVCAIYLVPALIELQQIFLNKILKKRPAK